MRTAGLVLLVIVALLSAPQPGKAQGQDPGAAAAPSGPAIEKLVQTLEDPQAREDLVKQLKALIEAQKTAAGEAPPAESEGFGARLLAALSNRIDVVAKQLSEATVVIVQLPDALAGLWHKSKDPAVLSRWAEIVGKIALVLLCGFVVQWLSGRALARARRAVEARAREGLLLRLLLVLVRTGLDLLPIGAFALAAYLVLPLTDPRPATRLVALALVNAYVLVAVVLAAARMLFAPWVPNLRLFAIDNETATYLYIWVRRLAAIGVYCYFFAEAGLLLGLPQGAHAVLIKTIGFVLTAMAVVLVLQNRRSVRDLIGRPPQHDGEVAPGAGKLRTLRSVAEWIAAVWHVAAIGLIVALYGTWALEIPHGFRFLIRGIVLTAMVAAIAWSIGRAIDAAVARGSRVPADIKEKFPRLEERVNRYLPLLRKVFKGLVFAAAGLVILEFWGIGALEWLGSDAGQSLISKVATILLLAGSALVIWELVSALIERALARHAAEDGGLQSPRVLTLLRLCRNIVRIVLVVMVTLIALSELGIDIGPLLAGAGVVGLAVGFGAQTLVKDVITGAFILMENSLAVGDWVDLGSHSGTVEAMTIRTVRLRDLQGTVHVIPFGEVTSVLNYNRDFGFTVVDIGVAYREDVDEVFKVLEAVGEDLQADETYGPAILEPLQVMGLNNLNESSVDIRVRLKTRAMMQWKVRRELLRRTKKAFDERGIEIPFPHRTLYFGVDRDGTAPPARIVQDSAG
jgi:moderate conductance mechanosensitive channel